MMTKQQPETRDRYAHFVTITTRWMDNDVYRHVNNVVYYSFPDAVQCGLRVAHLGNSSVRIEIGVFRNDETIAAAQGHFVHVACDRDTQRPVTMPAAIRAALEKLRLTAD